MFAGRERSQSDDRRGGQASELLALGRAARYSGFALRCLREKHGVEAMPVVLLGRTVDEEAAAGERGARTFTGQPFDPEQLIASTKQLPSA